MNTNADLIQRLGRSKLYNEFKQSFSDSTGLPLTLRLLEFWQLAHRGQPYENPFCAIGTQTNRGCAAYLETERRAVDTARSGPSTVRCFAGLCDFPPTERPYEETFGMPAAKSADEWSDLSVIAEMLSIPN